MKKIISLALAVIMIACCFALTSCGDDEKYVAIDASDLLVEDFGIAVKKGNTALMEEVNKVVDAWVKDGTMEKYLDYYTQLSKYEEGVEGVGVRGFLGFVFQIGTIEGAESVHGGVVTVGEFGDIFLPIGVVVGIVTLSCYNMKGILRDIGG